MFLIVISEARDFANLILGLLDGFPVIGVDRSKKWVELLRAFLDFLHVLLQRSDRCVAE